MIKKIFLNHKGGLYFYRVHQTKANKLCSNGISNLRDFMDDMFFRCPDDYFHSGPRSSKLKLHLNRLELKQVSGHEMSMLAAMGLKHNKDKFRDNHSKVQVFMLENDSKTIAMEVPVWLNGGEFKYFSKVFNSKEPLTGHIDIVRIEDDKIWVWDYKPNAIEEKFAATQIYFYCLMLSNRTGIPLKEFRCGYFDDRYVFIFDPNSVDLDLRSLNDF